LFEQFDEDIQRQIELLLGQLKSILQEGCDLLERRYGAKDTNSITSPPRPTLTNLSSASTLNAASSPTPVHRKSSPSIPNMLMWSLRDKKRVESIVRNFNDQNGRIHEKIKLWCLASQLGLNVQHLQRLQNDDFSKRLGFDVDANLRLHQWDAENIQTSLELRHSSWNEHLGLISPTPNQGLFALFHKDGKTFVQENHTYNEVGNIGSSNSVATAALDARTKNRVDSLAKLLHQPKEQVFRIPPCVGWKYLPAQSSIAFVFEVHSTLSAEPMSLLRLLSSTEIKPELGDKFRLALGLARCIAQLHMVKWVSHLSVVNRTRGSVAHRSTRAFEAKTYSFSLKARRWLAALSMS